MLKFQLPPGIIAHVLRGGQIPGLSPETLDKVMKEYLKRMHGATETAKREKLVTVKTGNLFPPEKLTQAIEVTHGTDMLHPDKRQRENIQV